MRLAGPWLTDLFARRSRREWGSLGAVFAGAILTLSGCDDGRVWFGRGDHGLCPRPQTATIGAQPGFGEVQQQVRALRRRAFQNDFFAQLELGKRYGESRVGERGLEDPVEAAVWYSMALANPDGYERGGGRTIGLYDDCRVTERKVAYRTLDRLLSHMSTDERDQVRSRVTYILSTQGAPGYRTLARLHDVDFGPLGEPPENVAPTAKGLGREGAGGAVAQLFERNDIDAYMFNDLALQTGDTSAYVLLQDFGRKGRGGLADTAETRARRWVPPYEFYPPDAPASGAPHTDGSEPLGDNEQVALTQINQLPFKHIGDALAYLRVSPRPVWDERQLSVQEVRAFQAMLGHPPGDCLTALEKVRAIQYAAVNGSAKAQLVLAVMYAQGVGVPADYARAFHWFAQADRQGSAEAKFAMANYFSEGVAGVADQDKAKAVVYQLDSALSGFRPSAEHLQAMLKRVAPRRGWRGYGPGQGYDYPSYGDGPPPDYGYGGGDYGSNAQVQDARAYRPQAQPIPGGPSDVAEPPSAYAPAEGTRR